MSLFESVPKLELKPEFSPPPLSPGRVGDYWRLFRDIFYFPQRLRDYVGQFARGQCGEKPPTSSWGWSAWSEWLGRNPAHAGLLQLAILFSLILLLVVVGLFGLFVALASGDGLPVVSMTTSFLVGLFLLLLLLVAGLRADVLGEMVCVAAPFSVTISLWLLVGLTPRTDSWSWSPWEAFLLTLVCGVSFGVTLSIAFALTESGLAGLWPVIAFGAVIGLLSGLIAFFVSTNLSASLVGAAGAFVGWLVGVARPDDWLLGAARMGNMGALPNWGYIAHVTPLPFGALSLQLKTWLEFDWKRGLENAALLWRYSGQHAQIRQAIHEILAEAKDDALVERVAQLADAPPPVLWGAALTADSFRSVLPVWSSPKTEEKGKKEAKTLRKRARQRLRSGEHFLRHPPILPTATHPQAVVAGFWYLGHGYPAAARDAFKKGPASPFGKEMISLADVLASLQSEENLLANNAFKIPPRPDNARRKASWDMLDKVWDLVRAARMHRQCLSQEKRTVAAEIARRLRQELATQSDLPHVEMRLLQSMARGWEDGLETWLRSTETNPLKAIVNPFVFAEPLREKQLHMDREAELGTLKEAWSLGNLQTVFIYGQPLVGKTSLLYNAEIANRSHVQLAWFRLGHSLIDHAPIAQVLSAICIAVRDATMLEVTVFRGEESYAMPDIERATDPFLACETFIRRVCRLVEPHNLVLALDDYDALEAAFADDAARDQFLSFLWHLYQAVRNFNVAFVSLRSPILFFQTRAANPFASTARILVVGNLDKGTCRRLLRAPVADFALHFSDDAIDAIFALSGGHPYFVQLIAYRLVQRFNQLAKDKKGEPLIERDDVEAIVGSARVRGDEEFSQRSRQFYLRMSQLAAQIGLNVTALLQTIADDYPLTQRNDLYKKLIPRPIVDGRALDSLLLRLQRYGVIELEADTSAWRIKIELWRRWITQQRPLLPLPQN